MDLISDSKLKDARVEGTVPTVKGITNCNVRQPRRRHGLPPIGGFHRAFSSGVVANDILDELRQGILLLVALQASSLRRVENPVADIRRGPKLDLLGGTVGRQMRDDQSSSCGILLEHLICKLRIRGIHECLLHLKRIQCVRIVSHLDTSSSFQDQVLSYMIAYDQ